MEYSKDLLGQLTAMGSLGYDADKIINVLNIEDEESFKNDFLNPDSLAAKAYRKGADQADFIIDQKLYELSKKGDLEALKVFEERKLNNKVKSYLKY